MASVESNSALQAPLAQGNAPAPPELAASPVAAPAAASFPHFPTRRRPSRKQLCCGCCLTLCLLLAILALLAPLLARKIAAGASMEARHVEMTEPREKTVKVRLIADISLPAPPLTPACDTAATTLSMSYDFGDLKGSDGKAMGKRLVATAPAPAMRLSRRSTVDVTTIMEIQDQEAMAALCAICMQSAEDVTLLMSGHASSRILGFPIGSVPVNIAMKAWGLKGLQRGVMEAFTLKGSDEQGVIVESSVAMENPTGLTLGEMGPIDVNFGTAGKSLGFVRLPGMRIGEGRTEVRATGHMVKPEDPDAAGQLFSKWLFGATPSLEFTARAESAPSWAQAALKAMKGELVLSKYQGPEFVQSVDVEKMTFEVNTDASVVAGGAMVGRMVTPFAFDFGVAAAAVDADVIAEDGTAVAKVKADLTAEWRPDGQKPGCGEARMTFAPTPMQVTDLKGLGSIIAGSLRSSTDVWMKGSARITTTSVLGALTVSMPFEAKTMIQGVNQFQGMSIDSLDMLYANKGYVQLAAPLNLPNPSRISMLIRPCLRSTVSVNGVDVGGVMACNTSIGAGVTTKLQNVPVGMSAESPLQLKAVEESVGAYVNGEDRLVNVRGDASNLKGDLATMLSAAMEAFNSQALLKGMKVGLIPKTEMKVQPILRDLPKLVVPGILFISNPWTGGMKVTRVSATIFTRDEKKQYSLELGAIEDQDLSEDPLVVKGKKQTPQPQEMRAIPAELLLGSCANGHFRACLAELQELAKQGRALVKVVARLRIVVGAGFTVDVSYTQQDLPVSLRFFQGELGQGAEVPQGAELLL